MKKSVLSLLALLVLSIGLSATVSAKSFGIGSKLEEFSLKDPRGKTHNIRDLKGKNGTLIVFLSAQCPVVEAYNSRVVTLAKEFESKGINFVGLYSNTTECLNWVKHHSRKEYKFQTLVDEGNVIADKLEAQYTPEVFYFNNEDILEYHGAIDNDRSGKNIKTSYLKTALDSKLAGKEIEMKETRAFGCSIKRVKG